MLHPCLLVLEIQKISYILVTDQFKGTDTYGYHMAPFGCADKPAEKHCWLMKRAILNGCGYGCKILTTLLSYYTHTFPDPLPSLGVEQDCKRGDGEKGK
jgi:hypothetical protein